ncbi:MAG TPA: hypothetical protein VF270_00215 [Ignavibacteriaceae bacterium]
MEKKAKKEERKEIIMSKNQSDKLEELEEVLNLTVNKVKDLEGERKQLSTELLKELHGIKENLQEIKNNNQSGISPLQFYELTKLVKQQTKPVQKSIRILLFPEQDAKLFYKIVFSRWLLYLCLMLAINNIYKWALNYSNNLKEIEMAERTKK